jgi:hypothetical protein
MSVDLSKLSGPRKLNIHDWKRTAADAAFIGACGAVAAIANWSLSDEPGDADQNTIKGIIAVGIVQIVARLSARWMGDNQKRAVKEIRDLASAVALSACLLGAGSTLALAQNAPAIPVLAFANLPPATAGFSQVVELQTDLPADVQIDVTWPDDSMTITGPDGQNVTKKFADAVIQVAPRKYLVAWPKSGKYPLFARSLYLMRQKIPQELTVSVDGRPVKVTVEIEQVVGFKELVASATLELTGGVAGPDESPPIYPPAPALAQAIAPVKAALAGHFAEAQELKRLYAALATLFARGAGQSTDQARQIHVNTAKYTLYGALAGKCPGLAQAVDGVLIGAVGTEAKTLDTTTRAALVDAFNALAFACQETR